MLEHQQGYRPQVETFAFAGGLFSVVDPAGILVDTRPTFQPVLHPVELPEPLQDVAVLVAGGVRDGDRVVRFEARITVAGPASDSQLHPAITGVAYVAPLLGAVSRFIASRTATDPVDPLEAPDPFDAPVPLDTPHTINDANTINDVNTNDDADTNNASATVTDALSELMATVKYGRPRFDGRIVHVVRADLEESAAQPIHLQGFVRTVFDVARRSVGRPDDDGYLIGRSFTLSRNAPSSGGAGRIETVRLDQIGGLDAVVEQLREVADSFNHPEAMARWGARRPQGLLMSGPPGTGKTTLARALATEIGGTLKEIRTPDILQKWVGASERNIKRIFTEARRYRTPTVLLFDEFDSIISYTGSPQGSADQAINSVAGIFKQEMNGLVEQNPNVIVVATTNFPERVDESLIRSGRFDVKIEVPLPDATGRADILAKMIRNVVSRHESDGFRIFAEDVDVAELAELSPGMSGADLKELLRRTQMAKAMQEARNNTVPDAITQQDLAEGITRMRRKA